MIQMLFRVQEEICWNRSLFGYYLCNTGAKNVENTLFFPVYIKEEKVTQGFLCIWLKDAAIREHVIC